MSSLLILIKIYSFHTISTRNSVISKAGDVKEHNIVMGENDAVV